MYGKVTLCVVFPFGNGYFGGRLMVSHPFLFWSSRIILFIPSSVKHLGCVGDHMGCCRYV
ncbi:Uncharacterized protein APZ42_004805 [Daphnia magna]|uniref:Uncharacterized protein n=1 Tax=Daphnia magna TaxID=35525 RepID=A0A164GU41_9CRUS|nr:Uncharacterized protein APZ42_004805 [Daphnia magna]